MNLFHKTVAKNTNSLYAFLLKNSYIQKAVLDKDTRRILDVGIGSGVGAKVMMQFKKFTVEGLDINNDLWDENNDIKNTIYDGRIFPFKNNSYDLILIFLVLHHANDPQILIDEVRRVTSKYVIVLEEVTNNALVKLCMILYDLLVNFLIFGRIIQRPNFKSEKQLESFFIKANLTIKSKIKFHGIIGVKRIAYLLEK